jgi:hypothetical protein
MDDLQSSVAGRASLTNFAMQRRSLLKLGAAAALQPLICRSFPARAATQLGETTMRRVRPGEVAWQSAAAWRRLNDEVGGNLMKVDSLFAPCRELKFGGCIDLWKNIRNPFYVGDQAGGTQVSGWLDAWTPQPSVYAVRARNSADVAAAVNFARENRRVWSSKAAAIPIRARRTRPTPC